MAKDQKTKGNFNFENIEKKEARLAGSGLMWIWVISREGQGLDFFTLWARLTGS